MQSKNYLDFKFGKKMCSVNIVLFLCVSLQGLYQMGWVRQWTTGIRVSESTSDTMEPQVESTWLQGSMDWLMVQPENISVHVVGIKAL